MAPSRWSRRRSPRGVATIIMEPEVVLQALVVAELEGVHLHPPLVHRHCGRPLHVLRPARCTGVLPPGSAQLVCNAGHRFGCWAAFLSVARSAVAPAHRSWPLASLSRAGVGGVPVLLHTIPWSSPSNGQCVLCRSAWRPAPNRAAALMAAAD